MTPEDFFSRYEEDFISAVEGTGIFPSVKAAQAALETGYGKSKVGNNLFGIKATADNSPYWKGKIINAQTKEVINGTEGIYNLDFRAYNSVSDSIRDHTHFLKINPRYTRSGVFSAKTPQEQAKALQAAGYATDPNYAQKLIDIMNRFNLYSLDKKKR